MDRKRLEHGGKQKAQRKEVVKGVLITVGRQIWVKPSVSQML